MEKSRSFTCPACGAEFAVQDRLDAPEPAREPSTEATAPVGQGEEQSVSFQCSGCGADYETEERLGDEPLAG